MDPEWYEDPDVVLSEDDDDEKDDSDMSVESQPESGDKTFPVKDDETSACETRSDSDSGEAAMSLDIVHTPPRNLQTDELCEGRRLLTVAGNALDGRVLHFGKEDCDVQIPEDTVFNTKGRNSHNVFNLMGNTGVNVTFKENKGGDTSVLDSIIDHSRLRLLDIDERLLVKTDAISQLQNHLLRHGRIIITGRSGEGKTTASLFLLKVFSSKHSHTPLILTDPGQWDLIPASRKSKQKYVVLIDDIFGQSNLVQDLQNRWEKKFPMMMPLVEAVIVSLIIVSRTNIFQLCKSHLLTYTVFKNYSAREFTLFFSEEEKLRVLENHIKTFAKDLKLTAEQKNQIIQTDQLLGFPQCCYLYATSKPKHSESVAFFTEPMMYLSDSIKIMRDKDPLSYLVLLLVMFYDGVLPKKVFDPFGGQTVDEHILDNIVQICSVNQKPTLRKIEEVTRSLCSVYLSWNASNKHFTFLHRCIYDVIFLEFCKDSLSKGIQMCSISTLLEYIRTKPAADTRYGSDWIVIVSEDMYDILAERITKELLSDNCQLVTAHPCLKDTDFIFFLTKSYWDVETKAQIATHPVEKQVVTATIYFTEETMEVLTNIFTQDTQKVLPLQQTTLKLFEYESITSYLTMAGAYNLALHLLNSLKATDAGHYEKTRQSMFVCSFYKSNSENVTVLIGQDAELTTECFIAACAAEKAHLGLFDLALGCMNENDSDMDTLQNMLSLCTERQQFPFFKRLIRMILEPKRIQGTFRQILLQFHNAIPTFLLTRNGQEEQFNLMDILTVLNDVEMGDVTDDCVLLSAGCNDTSALEAAIFHHGGNAHCKNKCQQTPLHLAAKYGSEQTLDFLYRLCGNPSPRDTYGFTPLHFAALSSFHSSEKVHIALIWKSNITDKTLTGKSALTLAVEAENIPSIDRLIMSIKEHGLQCEYPMHVAVSALICTLQRCHTTTDVAIEQHNKAKMIAVLQHHGYSLLDVDNKNTTSLQMIVKSGTVDLLTYLLQFSNVNKCVIRDTEVHVTIDSLKSLIYCAAEHGHLKVFRYFFEKMSFQTDNHVEDNVKSALCNAAEKGHLNIVQYFVEKDEDVNIKDESGVSPLCIAAKHGHLKIIVKFLVEGGVDVNVTDENRHSPLCCAARNGHTDIVQYLAETGADVTIKDEYGNSHTCITAENRETKSKKSLGEEDVDVNIIDTYGIEPLWCAVGNGHIGIVRYLVDKGASVHEVDAYGNPLLCKAVESGNTEIIRLLVEKCVDVNTSDTFWTSVLQRAAERGNTEMVRLLVEKGVDVNTPDTFWTSVFEMETERGNTEMVRFLLEKCVDVNITDTFWTSVLRRAAERGNTAMVRLLVVKGVYLNTPDTYWTSVLQRAAELGNTEMVRFLVEKGVDVNITDTLWTLVLQSAAEHGNTEVVRLLVEKGVDVNMKDTFWTSILQRAAERGNIEMVRFLVEKGVGVNITDTFWTLFLQWAAERGNIEMVRFLVEKGVGVNITDTFWTSVLQRAAELGNTQMIKLLVEKGVDVNMKDTFWTSILQRAAELGNIEMVRFLVEKGVGVNITDTFWTLFLQRAAERGNTEMVRFLVEKGVGVNITETFWTSILQRAAELGNTEMVRSLVEKDVHVNITDTFWTSVLQRAAELGNTQMIKLLMEKGVDVNTCIHGHTPLCSAAVNGHIDTVRFLVEIRYVLVLLCTAAENDNIEIVKYLLDKGVYLEIMNTYGNFPLCTEVANQHFQILQYLAKRGVNVNMKGSCWNILLFTAVAKGRTEVFKYLVERGADVNMTDSHGKSLMCIAAEKGHIEIVKYLHQKGVPVNITKDNLR
ncbi:uncharacterized protein [Haliotis cracherodii]|uniref:uncharacterized protein n=1 Tax=Haliotis cracherodii TaxID=6455 RepID=UPI0039ED3D18